MNAPAPNPYDSIATELRGLAAQDGAELWRNRPRLTGLLLDHQPELRREIRAIASAVEQGVAQALADGDRILAAIAIDRQAALLETESGLRSEVALNVVRAIAHALNLGPLPSVYAPGGGAGSDRRDAGPVPRLPPYPYPQPQAQPVWSDPHSSQRLNPPPYPAPPPRGRRFLWPAAILGGAALAGAAILIVPRLTGGSDGAEVTQPIPPADPALGYANELADYRVQAQSTLRADVRSPTPLQIPIARRVTTEQVRQLLADDSNVLLIDVLAGYHARTLANAHWLPSAGMAGAFTDAYQVAAKTAIDRLTGNDVSRPLLFFCMGASCWESYNAALRAAAMGYTNLYWYRGGLSAWEAAGLPLQPLGTSQDGS